MQPRRRRGLAAVGTTVAADLQPVIAYAQPQLGKPYLWGGSGPDAYDCSGLTMPGPFPRASTNDDDVATMLRRAAAAALPPLAATSDSTEGAPA